MGGLGPKPERKKAKRVREESDEDEMEEDAPQMKRRRVGASASEEFSVEEAAFVVGKAPAKQEQSKRPQSWWKSTDRKSFKRQQRSNRRMKEKALGC
eukprot:NODE_10166_length_344_cov_15.705085_g9256_i0.p1 GENE.NODE_10166_length_344_cov_15.705085_g9256_i0~~NODE_10166_length_344_cov_15.705085_g9256_i0.p1  ORF type:complete len:104 (+),score=37.37 NODE_10166_length_344_cov_15.705085_g9256_i0:24-314(+)